MADFYEEVIASGLVGAKELHEERTPTVGMDADLWRVQYLEDRIYRYGLALLILQRIADNVDTFDNPQCERTVQKRYSGYER